MRKTQDNPELKGRIRQAYGWTFAGNTIRYFGGFAISVTLARLLQTKDYGLIGMVLVFLSMLAAFQDLGVGMAVVRLDEDDTAIPTFFTASALFGLFLTVVVVFCAPAIADFYKEPELTLLLRVLAITIASTSICGISQALLTKRLQFKPLALIEMTSSLCAGCIAVGLAFFGMGVWSLVVNLLLFSFFQCAGCFYMVPPRFTLHPDRGVMRRVLDFGAPTTASNLLHQFYDNSDSMLIGRMIGPEALGIYGQAFRLATLVHERIGVLVNRVAFPSFAAVKETPELVIEHWFGISRVMSLINVPLLSFLFVNANDLILLVYGKKWLPAVVPLRFLCLVGVLRSLVMVIIHIYNALGKANLRLRFTLANFVLLPSAFAIGCKLDGIRGVGIAWCIVYPAIWLLALFMVRTFLRFSFAAYFKSLRLPALTGLLCVVFVSATPGLPGLLPRLMLRGAVWSVVTAACLLSSSDIRDAAMKLLRRRLA
jgi:O-antigen/teichoic acid export membrane protein